MAFLRKLTRNYWYLAWLLAFLFLFFLMLRITLKYFPFNSDVAFLQIKQTEVNNVSFYLPTFYVHVYSSILVLVAGFTQFNNSLLKSYRNLHRVLGYLYVIVVLFFSAPSGLVIGLFANGGLSSKVAFVILAILWFVFTLNATLSAKGRDFKRHQEFMLRSFALAFSAVTLRLWKVILVYLFHPAPMDVYQIIAWLGWVPNLLFVEWLIKNNTNKKIQTL